MKNLKITDREWSILKEAVNLGDKNYGVRESIYASENRSLIRSIGEVVKNIIVRNKLNK